MTLNLAEMSLAKSRSSVPYGANLFTVGINSKSFPWPVKYTRNVLPNFWTRRLRVTLGTAQYDNSHVTCPLGMQEVNSSIEHLQMGSSSSSSSRTY